MKKIIFIFAILIFPLIVKNLSAQGFTYTPLGANFIQLPYYPDSIQVVKHQGIIRNTSASTLNFRFARIVNNLPSGWSTQMCYDLCYAEFIDTISLPSDPPYSIAPNHSDTLFYIDFTCNGQGLGTSVVRMYNTDNPSLYVQDTFKVQIGNVGINTISEMADSYSLSQNYPNPFNPVTNINFSLSVTGNISLLVFDVLGNKLENLIDNQRMSSGSYNVTFDGSRYSSGIYYYTLITENFTDTKKMMLIK
ncbi:MAG: T9SS type A sorting domain-containing protein [Ignavibacteria bacterium]|nr:T9SS type A sorting domain-containing protein [Ignavibacteria bacterium]